MSLTLARSYFRTRMNSLNFEEWQDAFNLDNIPETIKDKAYHIAANEIVINQTNNHEIDLDHNVTLTFWRKGFRYPSEAIDNALIDMDAIILDVLDPSNRLTGTGGLRNILLTNSVLEEWSPSNDNGVKVTMNFRCRVYVCMTT